MCVTFSGLAGISAMRVNFGGANIPARGTSGECWNELLADRGEQGGGLTEPFWMRRTIYIGLNRQPSRELVTARRMQLTNLDRQLTN
jgi:hypothetical protein